MTIHVNNRETWISATDGTAITYPQLISSDQVFSTGLPYVITASTLAGLLNKMYVSPAVYSGNEDLLLCGGYHIESLTAKTSSQIIAEAD